MLEPLTHCLKEPQYKLGRELMIHGVRKGEQKWNFYFTIFSEHLFVKWKTKNLKSVGQLYFQCWPQLPLGCSARSGEAEKVGPERTERGFLPAVVFLDRRAATKLGGAR